jgi:hypothetical protein
MEAGALKSCVIGLFLKKLKLWAGREVTAFPRRFHPKCSRAFRFAVLLKTHPEAAEQPSYLASLFIHQRKRRRGALAEWDE